MLDKSAVLNFNVEPGQCFSALGIHVVFVHIVNPSVTRILWAFYVIVLPRIISQLVVESGLVKARAEFFKVLNAIEYLISPDPQLVIPAKAGIQSLLLLDSAKSRSQSLDSRQKHAGMTSQSHSSPSVQLRIEANQAPG